MIKILSWVFLNPEKQIRTSVFLSLILMTDQEEKSNTKKEKLIKQYILKEHGSESLMRTFCYTGLLGYLLCS